MGVNIFFCGDVAVRRNDRDYLVSKELQAILSRCSFCCCNFEAPIIDDSMKRIKKIGPSIFQNSKTIDYLCDANFKIFCLANNHIMDYGLKGLKMTCDYIESLGALHTGAASTLNEIIKPVILKIDDVKICIISVAENGFGAAVYDEEQGYFWLGDNRLEGLIKINKRECDYLIINSHAGAEEFKYPLPEIRNVYKKFIDWGADIIIGHHPHVMQGIEKYNNGLIFYSLGNFAFDNVDNVFEPYERESYGVIINISAQEQITYKIIPTIYENGVVTINKSNYSNIIEYINTLSFGLNENETYNNTINDFCVKKYNEIYKRYYREGVVGKYQGFIGFLKKIRRVFIQHRGFDDFFLYHNISIETHRWICQRATYLLINETNGRYVDGC